MKMPELMLLRGMHEIGCEDVWIIFADLTKAELDEVTEYFKLVCSANGGRTCKPSLERKIRRERAYFIRRHITSSSSRKKPQVLV